jgi:hypothetical protein
MLTTTEIDYRKLRDDLLEVVELHDLWNAEPYNNYREFKILTQIQDCVTLCSIALQEQNDLP